MKWICDQSRLGRAFTLVDLMVVLAVMAVLAAVTLPYYWNNRMHGGVGNICLSDGSVQQPNTPRLQEMLIQTGDTNGRNALVFPQSTVTGEP